jgi:hypothetical protein
MNKLYLLILLVFVVSCGGGSSGSRTHCVTDGYPLYCPTLSQMAGSDYCCLPDHPYACDERIASTLPHNIVCEVSGCPSFSTALDYCVED